MASGVVIEAVQDGQQSRVTVSVDEGAAGQVDYTAHVPIKDLRALATNAARKQALLAAVVAVRDDALQREAQIDTFLAGLIGAQVTV
jgi:hypothetical protein